MAREIRSFIIRHMREVSFRETIKSLDALYNILGATRVKKAARGPDEVYFGLIEGCL